MVMEYTRIYFGGFKDWLHRHRISLSSPSGLSKLWVFLQGANILYETGSHIIVPITGEETAFTVNRFSEVKDFADLVAKAKKDIPKVGDEDIETVFSNLKKKKNFPFFASEEQKDPDDPNDSSPSQDLKTRFLEKGRSEVTVIRLTKIRDPNLNNLQVKNPTSKDGEEILVPRDGSHATSLILIVHSQSPQTDTADNPDNDKTQLSTTTQPGSSHSIGPSRLAEEQFLLFQNEDRKWTINKADVNNICLRFTRKILNDYLPNKAESNKLEVDMSAWQKLMALLLIKVDELIKEDKKKRPNSAVAFLKGLSKTKDWTGMQKSAKENVLNEIRTLKPLLISLDDDGKLGDTTLSVRLLWSGLPADTFKDLFGTKTADGNSSSSAIRCPICAIGYSCLDLLQKHVAGHLATYRVVAHIQAPSNPASCYVCTYCTSGKAIKTDKNLFQHFKLHHTDLIPGSLPAPWAGWIKCPQCASSGDRIHIFDTQMNFIVHLATEHKNLSFKPLGAECPVCSSVHVNEEAMRVHIRQQHKHLASTLPGLKCPNCSRYFLQNIPLIAHGPFCKGPNSDGPSISTSSSKRPIEQSDEPSKSIKISSQDTSHASQIISLPNRQSLGNTSSTVIQDRPSVIHLAPRSSSK